MNVQVYKNLNRGDWSVRANGKVIDHRASVVLANVTFHVGKAAQAKVAAGAHRSVHAWAIGERVEAAPQGERIAITYRPHECASFVRRDNGQPVERAAFVLFTESQGAIAIGVVDRRLERLVAQAKSRL